MKREAFTISARIMDDDQLGFSAKLVLAEIEHLDWIGHCFASNGYFADMFDLSKSRVSHIVSDLTKRGYITTMFEWKNKQVIKRIIKPSKKGGIAKTAIPHCGNSEGNNLSLKHIQETNLSAFKKPTIDEVTAYAAEMNAASVPVEFFDYHESRGWTVGKAPMKSWQAAFRTWERNHHKFGKGKPHGQKSVKKSSSKRTDWFDIDAQF